MCCRDCAFTWLLNSLSKIEPLEIWAYGSFLCDVVTPNDADILIKYRSDRVEEAVQLRREITPEFERLFLLPLHAIFLSEGEWRDELPRIKLLLGSARRFR